ncbi:uncharacterized protein H6S33_002902 [Morchella sextelata]|uniref:uncharacterized protein n=1 Tax=Morchella sextelata TaxID=1174677 RepID=UPI001D058204|nr:uncharacterized protein H6S33_002902 [Morchella sextelata]KAH0606914.1 hypothetical protein H6S33_002902 [Morchella sextelata]
MSLPLRPGDVLNPNLYNNSDLEVIFYQRRKALPWTSAGQHALAFVYFALALLVLFGLLNLHDILLDRRRLSYTHANDRHNEQYLLSQERSTFDRLLLHLRSFGYTRSSWKRIGTTSFGLGILIILGFAYPSLYVFTQHPYYEREPRFGPPPLAGRGGMTALAMTPFVLMLGMKSNLISVITGVGHEKLNVLHRWLGYFLGFFSLVHAVPFIIEPLRNGGSGTLAALFRDHIVYWNGVGALLCVLFLCFGSLPFIRKWCYEGWVHLHIFCGVGYIAMLFWHCANMLQSWHFLYATVGIWATHLLFRFTMRTNWFITRKVFGGDTARFTALTNDGVKVTIPTRMKWRAGQHIFLRMPGISFYDNHPFTVSSVMSDEAGGDGYNDLVLVFKPHQGFTRKAFNISRSMPDATFTAYLDGPYGGLSRKLEAFETVLMIAGGSGITPIVAHLQHLVQKIKKGEALTRDIRIVWTVKHFESLEWFKDEISAAARALPRNMLLCQYYATEETPVELPKHAVSATREWPNTPITPSFRKPPPALLRPPTANSVDFEERPFGWGFGMEKEMHTMSSAEPESSTTDGSGASPIFKFPPSPRLQQRSSMGRRASVGQRLSGMSINTQRFSGISTGNEPTTPTALPPLGDEVLLEFGRPPLKDGLGPWSSTFGKRTCIYVCGPEQMKVDVANAVAKMQPDIWACEEREEVYLHSETFGW